MRPLCRVHRPIRRPAHAEGQVYLLDAAHIQKIIGKDGVSALSEDTKKLRH
jgi:hypothetical protein